jgi:hypothetical protein
MPSGAQQYIRGSTRPEKEETAAKYTKYQIKKSNDEGSDDFEAFLKNMKKSDKLIDARMDNSDAYTKEIREKYGFKTGGKIMKKATGGAMNAKRIANPNMPRQPMVPNPRPRPMPPRTNPRDNGTPLGPDDRPLGMPKPKAGGVMGSPVKPKGGMMGNGPFGPRNPNGPRKPMGSSSPMSGGIMAGMNSMVNKGRSQQSAAQQNLGTQAYNDYTKAMPRKKGGMAKGMK